MARQQVKYPVQRRTPAPDSKDSWPGVCMRLIDAVEQGPGEARRVYGLVVVVGLVLVIAAFAGVGAWLLFHG